MKIGWLIYLQFGLDSDDGIAHIPMSVIFTDDPTVTQSNVVNDLQISSTQPDPSLSNRASFNMRQSAAFFKPDVLFLVVKEGRSQHG